VGAGLREAARELLLRIQALAGRLVRDDEPGIFEFLRPPRLTPEEREDLWRQIREAENRLREINRQLQAAGQPPATRETEFGTFELLQFAPAAGSATAPAAARFDGSAGPWGDPIFTGPLAYAAMPVKAPNGSGKLPAHLLRSDPIARWSVWFNGIYTSFERSGAASTDGQTWTVMGGADYKLNARMLIGAALGYEDQRFNTAFDAGYFRGRGPTLGAYVATLLSPNLIANVFAGAAFLDYSASNGTATGAYDARRWFISASLLGTWRSGPWRFSPRANVFYASERRDGFTDSIGTVLPGSTVNVGRVSIGPEVGYRHLMFGRMMVEHFAFIALDCDLTSRKGITAANGIVVTDNTCGGRLGTGVNVLRGPNGMTGRFGISYNSLGRPDQSSWTIEGRTTMPFLAR
jgi:hypothetical protein